MTRDPNEKKQKTYNIILIDIIILDMFIMYTHTPCMYTVLKTQNSKYFGHFLGCVIFHSYLNKEAGSGLQFLPEYF